MARWRTRAPESARSTRPRPGRVLSLALTGLIVAGCASSGSSAGDTTVGSTTVIGSAANWKPIACKRPVAKTPQARPIDDVASDFEVTSFDGTRIRAHWFPISSAEPAPTVLMGPGWSLAGDVNTEAVDVPTEMSVLTIAELHDAGYNVLTWDPRGFGQSTGTVTVDSPDFEAKDVSVLMDWVATLDGVLLDADGDPRVGMVGASYGGGIQFVTAATDCRVDAITPTIAWNSLGTSLYKADTVKSGWADILVSISGDHDLDEHILSADEAGRTTGLLSDEDRTWFLERGPADIVGDITIPTLIVQGTVDGLFTLDEAVRNHQTIIKTGVPVSMLWYCGGHGACLTDPGPPDRVRDAILAWLDRYVMQNDDAPMVASFQTVDQNGEVHDYPVYPPSNGTPLTASGSGTLDLVAEGGSGPAAAADVGVVGSLAIDITPAKATNAVEVAVTNGEAATMLLGAPELTLTYSGSLTDPPAEPLPTRVFAQLVDDATGTVVGAMVTPIAVTLDGASHTSTTPLEIIVFDAAPGASLTLQIVATTVAYATPQLGGSITFSDIAVSIPTVAS